MINLDRLFETLQEPSNLLMRTRLRDELSAQLLDGTASPGEIFPSVAAIQKRLGIEVGLIHAAIQDLLDAGLLQGSLETELFVLGHSNSNGPVSPALTGQVVGFLAVSPQFHIYFGQLAASFNQCLQKAGWALEMATYHSEVDRLREQLVQMQQRHVRAFLIHPPASVDISPVLRDLQAQGCIIQLIGRRANYTQCDLVDVDNYQIGYQATRHLLELGHTRIIYAGGAHFSTAHERAQGYVKAMQEAGFPPRIFNVYEHRDFSLPEDLHPYLDSENTPTALWREMVRRRVTAAFCFNYEQASWVFKETRKFNLMVPRDISLITAGNPPDTSYASIALTTFALPGEEMGRQAAQLMLRRLAGEEFPPQEVVVPAQLLLRSSTSAQKGWRTAPV